MFLMTLRGGFQDYVINAAALIYLHEQDAPAFLIERLMAHDGRQFADEDILDRPSDRIRDHRRQGGPTGQRGPRSPAASTTTGCSRTP